MTAKLSRLFAAALVAASLVTGCSRGRKLRQDDCASYDSYAVAERDAIVRAYQKPVSLADLVALIDAQLEDARTSWTTEQADNHMPFDCYISAISAYWLALDELRATAAAGDRSAMPASVSRFVGNTLSPFLECHRLLGAHCR